MKALFQALADLPPAVYNMAAVVAIYGLYKLVKWIRNRFNSPLDAVETDEQLKNYTIKSERDFDLMRDAMWSVFSEDVAINDHAKIAALVESWIPGKYTDFNGYLNELADLLETCSSIDWQTYHFNLHQLKVAANDINKSAPVNVIEGCMTLSRIYRCLTDVLKERDFRE